MPPRFLFLTNTHSPTILTASQLTTTVLNCSPVHLRAHSCRAEKHKVPETKNIEEGSARRNIARKHDHDPTKWVANCMLFGLFDWWLIDAVQCVRGVGSWTGCQFHHVASLIFSSFIPFPTSNFTADPCPYPSHPRFTIYTITLLYDLLIYHQP